MSRIDHLIRAVTQDVVTDELPYGAHRVYDPMNRRIERLDRVRVALLSTLAGIIEGRPTMPE